MQGLLDLITYIYILILKGNSKAPQTDSVCHVNIRWIHISSNRKDDGCLWVNDKLMVKGFLIQSKAILMIMAHNNTHREGNRNKT